MSGRWTMVRVRRPQERAAIIAALFQLGAEGIEEVDADLITHLRDIDTVRVSDVLRRTDATTQVEYELTPDTDWTLAWREQLTAHRVGTLVVTPPWLASQFSETERIIIDPGMAFGTGEHETTRGVLRLMKGEVRPGDSVADLGAGSAVLSIAAAKLGAARVVAIELDPDAIGNAAFNVNANEKERRVAILEGDAATLLPFIAPVRLVLANIVSGVLVALLPVIGAALTDDGVAILSGILIEEEVQMRAALTAAGWRIRATHEEGIWWSVSIARR